MRLPAATPGGRAAPGATPGASQEGEVTEPGGAGEVASGGRAAMAATAVGSNGGYVNGFVIYGVYPLFFLSLSSLMCLFYLIAKSGIYTESNVSQPLS